MGRASCAQRCPWLSDPGNESHVALEDCRQHPPGPVLESAAERREELPGPAEEPQCPVGAHPVGRAPSHRQPVLR